jgi:hypothetical protein
MRLTSVFSVAEAPDSLDRRRFPIISEAYAKTNKIVMVYNPVDKVSKPANSKKTQ